MVSASSSINPILNNPYEEPTSHYNVADSGEVGVAQLRTGRRPFTHDVSAVPVPAKQLSAFGTTDFASAYENQLVNLLRTEMGKWRAANYPGTTAITRTLLFHWFGNPLSPDPLSRDNPRKLFFAQREAIETAIWLAEVAPTVANVGAHVLNILRTGREQEQLPDTPALPRTAFRMATGSGKTVVMAALILYHYFNYTLGHNSDRRRYAGHFLLVAPGVTIRDRLGSLRVDPTSKDRSAADYYRQRGLVPPAYERELAGLNARIVITNYHAFEPRTLQGNKRSPTDGKLGSNKQDSKESLTLVINRVLGKAMGRQSRRAVLVLNDEAHHCYLPIVRFQYAHDGNSFGNIASEYITTVNLAEMPNQRCVGKEDRGYTYVDTQGSALRLTSITCGQEEVRFEAASAERQDLASAHALQRIAIYYAGQAKRAFRFYTQYVSASNVGTSGTYYIDVHNQSRLQLDSLREESADGHLVKPAYAFAYFAGQLPYRGSAAQDHWGYFNGQDNRTRVGYTLGGQRLGAQKSPDYAYGIIGNLAAIRYPTGGTTQFTYESNQYHRSPADVPLPVDSTFTQVLVETYDGQDGNTPGDVQGYEAQQTFELTSSIVEVAAAYPPRHKLPVRLVQHQLVDAVPTGQENGFTVNVILRRVGSMAAINFAVRPDSGAIAYLTPGRYTLFVQIEKEFPWQQDHRIIHMDASLSADITTSAFAANRVYNGPGLRIKQIQRRPGLGSTETTTYDYTDPATGTSSGLLANTPNYEQHRVVTFFWENPYDNGQYTCSCYKHTSNSNYPLINSRSSYVGYSHVAEYHGDTNEQGFKSFDFTNFDRYNDLNATPLFPYPPVTSHDSKRGLTLREQVFVGPGNASVPFQRIQVDSASYDELGGSLDWAYGVKMADGNNMGSLTNVEDVSVLTDSYYSTETAVYRLEATSFQQQNKTRSLFAKGKPFTTISNYQYTPDTYQPNRITSTTSDGSRIVQRLYYPTDYRANAPSSPILTGLLAANRITVPLEQSNLRSYGLTAQLTSGTIHEYGLVQAPDGYQRFYLKKIYAANTATPDTSSHYTGLGLPTFYEEKARVSKTTGHNQPVVEKDKRYQVSSYLWGYDDRYPIANCTNATDAEIFHESFEENNTAATGAAHSGTKYLPGAYTINWVRPNTRVYVLRYWFRQNGSWRYRQVPYTGTSINLTDGDAHDDVSIYPQDAQLTTSTYDPLVGITSQTDPSGRTTTYEYDGLGRLIRTRDEQGRVLSQQLYHYAQH